MAKKRLFTGNAPIGGKPLKSRRLARKVTSKFHDTRNQLAILETRSDIPESEKERVRQEIKQEIENIGGIDAYQQASVISTHHFNTSKWILKSFRHLVQENKVTLSSINVKPKILEVGAINSFLAKQTSLDMRCIDINSQHPLIEERDFFTLLPEEHFDAVVCSMVINCVPEPEKRGEMLCRLIMQIHPGGVLFLVLPRRCIHSPMVGEAQFESLLAGLGCVQLLPKRLTPRIIFYILGRRTDMLSSHSSSSRSGSITTSVLKLENKVSLRQTDDKEHFTKWESKVCELIKLYMDEATVQHFSAPINNKEYSQLDKSSKQSEDPRKYKSLISKSTKEEETSVNSTSVIAPLVIEAQKFSLYIPIKYISQIRL